MSSSEIFAIVQQLLSQINENRISQMLDAVKGLTIEDSQMIVDLLSRVYFCPPSLMNSEKLSLKALEKHHHDLMYADRILDLLTLIASSANIIARNRTLNPEQLASEAETSSGVYIIQDELHLRVRVIKQGKKDAHGVICLPFPCDHLT
jgi:hypothetical protein